MYGIKVLSYLHKSFPVKLRTTVSSIRNIQQNVVKTKTSFDIKSQVKNEVVIFNYENPKYFIAVNLFSGVQCVFWSYLGLFLFQSLNKTNLDPVTQKKFWGRIVDLERKYSDTLSAISLLFGWTILVATFFYSLRSVRKIILHKGGKDITIVTYNLPGFNTFKTPLINVSSMEHRLKAKKYIPVKLKNKYFYYLLDARGEFANPTLFDFTVGIQRSL